MPEPINRSDGHPAPSDAEQRFLLFQQVLDSKVSSEQPNYALVFSDCAFGVFYTPSACANFAVALMRGFLDVRVPVRMGLGFGTFHSMGTNTGTNGRSTVVRAMFGGTSVVRAVAAESCGGKGMRIFAHPSFSELFARCPGQCSLLPVPRQMKTVCCELDYVTGGGTATIQGWISAIKQMARSAPYEFQNHYTETLAALSRMNSSEPDRDGAYV